MRYHELISILQHHVDIANIQDNSSSKIRDIKVIEGQLEYYNATTLYLSTNPKFTRHLKQPLMLLCTYEPDDLHEDSSLAVFCKEQLQQLLALAREYLYEDLRADAALLELAEAALCGKSIVQIINTAATLVENALILVDHNMKVLAHSTIYEIADPLWAESVEKGYCSHEFMQKVRADKRIKEWSKLDGQTKIIQLPGDLQPKLVARLTCGGHFIGSLVMIEHYAPIKSYHHRQLPLIGKMLAERLNHHSLGSIHSVILYDLLDKSDISDTLKLIKMSKASFPQEMYVVVARFVSPVDNRYLKRTIAMDLQNIFATGQTVQYKSYIAILVTAITAEQKDQLAKIAQEQHVSIGISWPFGNILEFKRHFNQAVASIKQAQRLNLHQPISDYTDFVYYDLLYNYTGKLPLQDYCHPALKTLHKYDHLNNTKLFITLRTFLECNKNLRTTSEKLFIHRNSLTYRLNRINEITKLDLNNTKAIDSLKDSFRIETFLQSMKTDT